MEIKHILILALALLLQEKSFAQNDGRHPFDENYLESCTSITVGKKASSDGSVMTSHTCDSNFRTWLSLEKGREFAKGEKDTILWGTLHTEERFDKREIERRGVIPAPDSTTFKFLNVA